MGLVAKQNSFDYSTIDSHAVLSCDCAYNYLIATVSKPIIQEFPKDTIILEGQAVTFEPKVVGTPPPTVAWYHNGSIISSDYAMEVKNDGSLVLACAELKHTGTYRFTVSNSAGSVQGQVSL